MLEVPSSNRGSRSARSVPAFGEFVEDDIQDEISVIPADNLSRKQRKFQNKQDCHVEGMKCTSHDNDHWRVKPFWTCKFLLSFCSVLIFKPEFLVCHLKAVDTNGNYSK